MIDFIIYVNIWAHRVVSGKSLEPNDEIRNIIPELVFEDLGGDQGKFQESWEFKKAAIIAFLSRSKQSVIQGLSRLLKPFDDPRTSNQRADRV
ncbi:hypothetical protein L1987_47185 [Smallanthus sonchifolius]|uniref:Uncharacterized protein n=1 Tax=Smallanthus sonchifolius TaxID=185202 RepID=A0ACB9G2U8_9ASTR|nr:hypothetical protein L1987_47185 [Smallanthus sonchifolius]